MLINWLLKGRRWGWGYVGLVLAGLSLERTDDVDLPAKPREQISQIRETHLVVLNLSRINDRQAIT